MKTFYILIDSFIFIIPLSSFSSAHHVLYFLHHVEITTSFKQLGTFTELSTVAAMEIVEMR